MYNKDTVIDNYGDLSGLFNVNIEYSDRDVYIWACYTAMVDHLTKIVLNTHLIKHINLFTFMLELKRIYDLVYLW